MSLITLTNLLYAGGKSSYRKIPLGIQAIKAQNQLKQIFVLSLVFLFFFAKIIIMQ